MAAMQWNDWYIKADMPTTNYNSLLVLSVETMFHQLIFTMARWWDEGYKSHHCKDGLMLSKQIAKFHLTTVKMSLKVEIEQKTQVLSNKRVTSRADDERIRKLYGQQKCRACTFVALQILGSWLIPWLEFDWQTIFLLCWLLLNKIETNLNCVQVSKEKIED